MIQFSLVTPKNAPSEQQSTAKRPDIRAFVIFSDKKKNKNKKSIHLPADVKKIDTAIGGALTEALQDESFTGAEGQVLLMATHGVGGTKRIMLVGAGSRREYSVEMVRRVCGTLAGTVSRVSGTKVQLEGIASYVGSSVDNKMIGEAIAQGVIGAAHTFLKYKEKEAKKYEKTRLQQLTIVEDRRKHVGINNGLKNGEIMMEAMCMARDVVNEPASAMTPTLFRKRVEQLGKMPRVTVKTMGPAELKRMKAGALLGVAQGSQEPGYLIHLTYKPTQKAKAKLAFVGKGITFDSGGLSIKPANYMEDMKVDMAGAASVVAALQAVAELKLPVELHAVAAVAENMVSGTAQRPGDVVTAMNGKTIEVLNTDAEGRLVMADALSYVGEQIEPDMIADAATLTGIAAYAFGEALAPYMCTDDKLAKKVQDASDRAGEPLIRVPLVKEYASSMKSQLADVRNISTSQYAGSITAALFLQHFVPKHTPWVHFDIAGPAHTKKPTRPYYGQGASGFIVQTLIELVRSYA